MNQKKIVGSDGLINILITAVKSYQTGGINAAWDQVNAKVTEYAYNQLEQRTLDFLPEELANSFNGYEQFFKAGFTSGDWGSLPEIDVNNMGKYLDFGKITDYMNIDNLQLDTNNLLDSLNLEDSIKNMDLNNIANIDDLEKVVGNIDLNNFNSIFDEGFENFAVLDTTNFDGFANVLSSGISMDSIESIQDGILNSFDKVVTGLTDAEYEQFSNQFISDLSKQVADSTSAPVVDQLSGSISGIVKGKFDAQILTGLQNEFSKQVTGLSYHDLSKMAEIPSMDLDKIKNLSGQVTGITSTLKGAEYSIENLSSQANKLSKDITGMDTRVLNSVASSITNLDSKVISLGSEVTKTKDVLNSTGASKSDIKNALNQIETLESKVNQLQKAGEKLNLEDMTRLQTEINICNRDLNKTINAIEGLDDINLNKIKTQVSKLDNQATNVIDHITSLDTVRLNTVLSKIERLDKTGLVELATDLGKLDCSSNGMQDMIRKYGDDITGLKTSEINKMMKVINGQNIDAQDAIRGISKYLMNSDQKELAKNLNKLGGTINLLDNYTTNLDTDKIIKLTGKVVGFDSVALNNFALQVSRLENASIEDLFGKVDELPNKVLDEVSEQITEQITASIKNQVSANISNNLKNNIMGTNGFSNKLKKELTAGEKFNGADPGIEEETVKDPYAEYSTGFYIREVRNVDYFQIAEPLRVLYPASHWRKMFREDKYIILDSAGIDMDKIDDEDYVEKHGKTIWEATGGDIESAIYGMLQGVQSSDSQYLYRYFKELFNDFSWVFDGNWGFSVEKEPGEINPETIGWIFKTAEVDEPVFSGDLKEHSEVTIGITAETAKNTDAMEAIVKKNMPADADFYTYECHELFFGGILDSFDYEETAEDNANNNSEISIEYKLEVTYFKYENRTTQKVTKTEYQPATWAASQIGILNPKSHDQVYGFKEGLDIISPVNGVVIAKTNASKNELGEKVAESVTIELKNTGDKNADGMRIILIGGDYSSLMVGSVVTKVTYILDDEGKYTGETAQSVIGKTTDEPIKVMVLDKDGTPVDDVSDYIHPPYEDNEYKPELGDEENE